MSDVIVYAISALLAAIIAMGLLGRRSSAPPSQVALGDVVFLFAGDRLVDGSTEAFALLEAAPPGATDLFRVQSALSPRFADLNEVFQATTHKQSALTSTDGTHEIIVDHLQDGLRLTVKPLSDYVADLATSPPHLDAMRAELDLLRANTNIAPFLAWRQDSNGVITWINRSYLRAAKESFGAERVSKWPLPALFSDLSAVTTASSERAARIEMLSADPSNKRWFECTSEQIGSETLFTAVEATATVVAETRLREFMQTLTETFAQLPIGLAIFDRSRRLVLFNPSLITLTSLKAEVLTARPSLASFLDALREQRMMPEPRDYKSWRASLSELELAAEKGTYEEIWSLSEGQTYRVTGRPHPDGAIALLFEDISSEISLTRQFRSELTLGQSVLDNLDDAVAVFSSTGVLTMVNSAYASLWGSAPDTTLDDVSITDATRTWSDTCFPSPVWGDLRDFVLDRGPREDWQAIVQMNNGRTLSCRFVPIAGGATLATFSADSAGRITPETPANKLRETG